MKHTMRSLLRKLFGTPATKWFAAKQAKQPQRCKTALNLETLERRELMAAGLSTSFAQGILVIHGTPQADVIRLTSNASGQILMNGQPIQGNPTRATTRALRVFGHGGDDVLDARQVTLGRVTLNGGAGDDSLWGSRNAATLLGGTGDDILKGGSGSDILKGGAGNDHLFGMSGDDQLFGGIGNDWLEGNRGRDTLNAGEGADAVFGGAGDDWFVFDRNDDFGFLDFSADVFDGGEGQDSFQYPFSLNFDPSDQVASIEASTPVERETAQSWVVQEPALGRIKADLAWRLHVPIEEIELVHQESEIWTDSSLGRGWGFYQPV
ncbi:MAG: hypothetical protein H0W86_11960 [Armatimonadetes bacterium]|nr:hypothetical protein [Armatimonadota bacterium]